MTSLPQQSLASLVTSHHQTAQILEKYQLDFCCKGKRTLSQACQEKGLSLDEVMNELNDYISPEFSVQQPFSDMNAEQLISFILIHHHFYVKQSMPLILGHLEKVATKHGDRFPYMKNVFELFAAVKNEMTMHMHKEEMILFPRIKEIETLFLSNKKINLADGYITGPVTVMEMEHEHAGEILDNIRQLTNNYTAPEEACTTFKLSLTELKEFEEDLHRHVHLENYLLFPLAEKMLTSVTTA